MAVITYTAKRQIMSGHGEWQSYSFNVALADWNPEPETPGDNSISLSGRRFETLHRIEDAWQAETIAYSDPAMTKQLDEFLYSVAAGEQFEIDPFGTIASPDNPIQCKLSGTSKFSKDVANTAGPYYRYSFKAWKSTGLSYAVISLLGTASFSRPSAAWAWGSDQLLDDYAADELRQDYDPADGTFRGTLVEESRTNQLLDNRDPSAWSSFGGSISASRDADGIDGEPNQASTVSTDEDADTASFLQAVPVSDNANAVGVFHIRKDEDESRFPAVRLSFRGSEVVDEMVTINTRTGDVFENASEGSYTINDVGQWWQVKLSLTNNASGNDSLRYQLFPARSESSLDAGEEDSSTGSIVFDFGQIVINAESGSSLIETDGTATTRAADVLEGPFSESSGTLHFVGETVSGYGWQVYIHDGSGNNFIKLQVISSDFSFRVNIDDGGITQTTLKAGTVPASGIYNVALRFGQDDFAVSLNGDPVVKTTDANMPVVDTIDFGASTEIEWFKRGDLRRALLTDEQLQELTK